MSLRKLCFYTMLAAILAWAVAGRLNRHSKEFDVPEANAGRNDLSFAASFRLKSEMLPADLFPVQSKNAKSLGAGKLLVASRNLGDPRFAKTVILLARYDAQGVLGLILNRRTDVPLSRVLESPKAAKDRSDPVYLGGHAWFIFPADASTVFNANPDSLWLEMIRKTELQLARSEPVNADPWILAGQFADLRYKR